MENVNFKGKDSPFAVRLRELMLERKLTQDSLSKKIGITRQGISKYCEGTTMPNIGTLHLFREFFDVSTEYLMGYTDVKKADTNVQAICEHTGHTEKALDILKGENGNIYIKLMNVLLECASEEGNFLWRLYRYLTTCYGDEFLEYSRNTKNESEIKAVVRGKNEKSSPFYCDGQRYVPSLIVPLKEVTEQTLLSQIVVSASQLKASNLFKL